jgi:hypothetical protein
MIAKGYDHPLISLDLLPPYAQFPEDPIYSVQAPQGYLVVHPNLRRRGEDITTDDVLDGVCRGLAAHAPHAQHLGGFGLDDDWRRSMEHWAGRVELLARDRASAQARQDLLVRDRKGLRSSAHALWRRLGVCTELARVVAPVRGAPPTSLQRLLAGLQHAEGWLAEPAQAPLATMGFGPLERELLREVIRGLQELPEQERAISEAQQRASASLQVVRGALLGDLAFLSRAARQILGTIGGGLFAMRRLLGQPAGAS